VGQGEEHVPHSRDRSKRKLEVVFKLRRYKYKELRVIRIGFVTNVKYKQGG
jgi:hypothetical protein